MDNTTSGSFQSMLWRTPIGRQVRVCASGMCPHILLEEKGSAKRPLEQDCVRQGPGMTLILGARWGEGVQSRRKPRSNSPVARASCQ